MARFTLPRDIYFGKGCMEDVLKNLKGKKAIIVVGGGSMKRFGFLDRAVNALKEANIEVELFENVEPDPSVETVLKGAKAMREFDPARSSLFRPFAARLDYFHGRRLADRRGESYVGVL